MDVTQLDLPKKVERILFSDSWYHATTKSNFENILAQGVVADHNRYSELDFGYGFYLTTSGELAESYISRLFSKQGPVLLDPPVIMEYEMNPLEWFQSDRFKCAVFPAFDDDFAEFVFLNRRNCDAGIQIHDYDVIYGVMSDSAPTKLLLEYRAGEISSEVVIEGLKKSNRMKQISLHSQALCDIIKLKKAYQYNPETDERKELDIYEREGIAGCKR